MDADEFNPEDYESEQEVYDTQEFGPNDQYGFYPGEIVYGVWDPPGTSSPTHYGLVGIESHGVSIRDFSVDNDVVVFVLHN